MQVNIHYMDAMGNYIIQPSDQAKSKQPMASKNIIETGRQDEETGSKLCNWLTSIWNLFPQPYPRLYSTAMWPFWPKYYLNKQTLTVFSGILRQIGMSKNGIYLGNKVASPSVLLRDVAPPLCALLRRATWALNWHSELFEISTVVQHSTPRSSNFGWQSFQNLWQLSFMDDYRLLSSTVPIDA